MKPDNQDTPLVSRILAEIHSGNIKMRPKWQFILNKILLITGLSILFLTTLYLVSFVLFVMKQNGVWFVPSFGLRGWLAFMISLPWLLILLSLIFMLVLELLAHHFAFAYQRPLLYSLLGIMIIVLFGGFAVHRTTLHAQLALYSEKHHLPIAGHFYRGFGHERFGNIHHGLITGTTTGGILIRTENGDMLLIGITPRTRLPFGMDFTVGDIVVVFGDRAVDGVQAYGIRKMPAGPLPMHRYKQR